MGLVDRILNREARVSTLPTATSTGRVLTAAARRVELADSPARGMRASTVKPAWQADAWTYRDAVGEVRYAMDWLASVMARIRLIPATIIDPEQPPVHLVDATTPKDGDEAAVTDLPPQLVADAVEALRLLAGGGAGHGHLLDPLTVNMEVPGECYLLGMEDADGVETWSIRSTDELVQREGGWVLVEEPGQGVQGGQKLDPETSFVARLWKPHPRWHAVADSAMRGVLSSCEALLIAERRGRVRDRARLSQGMLLVAQELDFEAEPGETQTTFMGRLTRHIVGSVSDEGSTSSIVPLVSRIPADLMDKAMKYVDLGASGAEAEDREDKKIARHLTRIVRGLDVPPEVVEGLADVKFANAVAIDSTSFRYHVEPKAQRAVDALTEGYLWLRLEALGWERELYQRIVIWYDPTEVVTNPNRLPDALNLHKALAISDETLRDAAGYDDTAAPSEEELLRRIGTAGTVDASLTYALLTMVAAQAGITIPAPTPGPSSGGSGLPTVDGETDDGPAALPSGETQQPDAVAASAASGSGDPAPWTARALALDLDLRSRVEAAADSAMRRALERAGARVVSRTQGASAERTALRAKLAGLPTIAVCAALTPAELDSVGVDADGLLDGAFTDVAASFSIWATATWEQGLQAACDLLGLTYYPPEALTAAVDAPPFTDADTGPLRGIDQLAARARFATDLAEAADGLVADLHAEARARLFSPTFQAPTVGEHDPALAVRPGLVRRALAVAGGAGSSPAFSGVDARGVVVNPTDGDAGYVATGRTLVEGLTVAGVPVYAYRWVWGGSPRPFHPHKALDGRTFADQSDSALAVPDAYATWLPATSYFPGDHDGCRCSNARLVDDPYEGMTATEAKRVRAAQAARGPDGRFVRGPSF